MYDAWAPFLTKILFCRARNGGTEHALFVDYLPSVQGSCKYLTKVTRCIYLLTLRMSFIASFHIERAG